MPLDRQQLYNALRQRQRTDRRWVSAWLVGLLVSYVGTTGLLFFLAIRILPADFIFVGATGWQQAVIVFPIAWAVLFLPSGMAAGAWWEQRRQINDAVACPHCNSSLQDHSGWHALIRGICPHCNKGPFGESSEQRAAANVALLQDLTCSACGHACFDEWVNAWCLRGSGPESVVCSRCTATGRPFMRRTDADNAAA